MRTGLTSSHNQTSNPAWGNLFLIFFLCTLKSRAYCGLEKIDPLPKMDDKAIKVSILEGDLAVLSTLVTTLYPAVTKLSENR